MTNWSRDSFDSRLSDRNVPPTSDKSAASAQNSGSARRAADGSRRPPAPAATPSRRSRPPPRQPGRRPRPVSTSAIVYRIFSYHVATMRPSFGDPVRWAIAARGPDVVPRGRRGHRARRRGKTLDIYFIDVEGGQSTLIVTPAGQSLLIDAGYPGIDARDPDRIMAAVRDAGVKRIDYLLSRTCTRITTAAWPSSSGGFRSGRSSTTARRWRRRRKSWRHSPPTKRRAGTPSTSCRSQATGCRSAASTSTW